MGGCCEEQEVCPDPNAGTLTLNDDPLDCDSNACTTAAATPNGDKFIPDGYSEIYVLTSGDALVIEQVNDAPEFTVCEQGLYTIHTLVFDTATLDLGIVEIGVTTGFDVNSLLIQGGGDICASLDVAGAPFEAPDCTPAKIGNQVWKDTDCDGIRESGEPMVEGLTVNLWKDNEGDGTPDVLLETDVTNANGRYSFDNLVPDMFYIVQFDLTGMENMFFTTPDNGAEGKDSDVIDPDLGITAPVFLTPGETNNKVDAGLCNQEDPCPEEIFNGGLILAGACTDNSVMINSINAPDFNGEPLEIVWIKSTNADDCATALFELGPINVGAVYDEFVAAGGFGVADPQIGTSSWIFVADNDGDDLKLSIDNVSGAACYMRLRTGGRL